MLADKGCQIVVTSSNPPEDFTVIYDALIDFQGAVYADIAPLDVETCKKIVLCRASQSEIRLSDELVNYISELKIENVRAVEGILSNLFAQIKLMGSDADLEVAIKAYKAEYGWIRR